MMDPIMGSETEFGLVPRGDKKNISRILNYFRRKSMFLDESKLRNISPLVNWWGERFKKSGPEDKKEEYIMDVARQMGMSGEYLKNGSRFYVDGYHLEYSTPECRNPWELVAHEKAGEKIVFLMLSRAERELGMRADLLKRNADYTGSSYACHENYLLSRRLFDLIAGMPSGHSRYDDYIGFEQMLWTMHLISRQIYTGCGRINHGEEWPECFKLSQRQGFMKYFAAYDTTATRSIINLRDRPYADRERFGRLHVICGDSNRADWSNILKYGTSSLVLAVLDDSEFCEEHINQDDRKYFIAVKALRDFIGMASHKSEITTEGGTITALGAQKNLLNLARAWHESRQYKSFDWAPRLIDMWEKMINLLEGEDEVELQTMLDYFAKKKIFNQWIEANGNADVKKLRSLEYSYHLVRDGSLFEDLITRGLMRRVVGEEDVTRAFEVAPPTRAAARSKFLNLCSEPNIFNSWHTIVFGEDGEHKVIVMPDPSSEENFICEGDRLLDVLRRGGR